MRILWCDGKGNTPSFQQMRNKLLDKLKDNITFAWNIRKFNMPLDFPEEGLQYGTETRDASGDIITGKIQKSLDVIVIGPRRADLENWGNLDEYTIPKVMIVSDPQSDLPYHIYYARKYKVDMLLFLYPAWIPIYQKYLNCKMDTLPWWLDECKQNVEKNVDLAYSVEYGPYHPIRWLVSTDMRLGGMKETGDIKVPFGFPRLPWNEYINLLNRTKILVFDGSFYNLPILKYVEGMATECCMLAPTPEAEEVLHLKPYENYIPVTTDNYLEQIIKYLNDDGESQRIAKNARETFLKYNTTEIRMNELLQKLELLING